MPLLIIRDLQVAVVQYSLIHAFDPHPEKKKKCIYLDLESSTIWLPVRDALEGAQVELDATSDSTWLSAADPHAHFWPIQQDVRGTKLRNIWIFTLDPHFLWKLQDLTDLAYISWTWIRTLTIIDKIYRLVRILCYRYRFSSGTHEINSPLKFKFGS